jgi:hypothetical protein
MGLALTSGQKLTLGLLATIALDVSPFIACAPSPAPLPFSKCILEALLCEGVQHRLPAICLHHLEFAYRQISQLQPINRTAVNVKKNFKKVRKE